jgi:hypothetical protein
LDALLLEAAAASDEDESHGGGSGGKIGSSTQQKQQQQQQKQQQRRPSLPGQTPVRYGDFDIKVKGDVQGEKKGGVWQVLVGVKLLLSRKLHT